MVLRFAPIVFAFLLCGTECFARIGGTAAEFERSSFAKASKLKVQIRDWSSRVYGGSADIIVALFIEPDGKIALQRLKWAGNRVPGLRSGDVQLAGLAFLTVSTFCLEAMGISDNTSNPECTLFNDKLLTALKLNKIWLQFSGYVIAFGLWAPPAAIRAILRFRFPGLPNDIVCGARPARLQRVIMDKSRIRAAGYVRVSSKEQVEGESLSTQRQSIRDYVKQQGWELTRIYADEGISGGSVKERHALLECLHDARIGMFNLLVIHRLSRFGRNARELLDNEHELQNAGIQLRSIKEGIDFGNRYGKAMLGMFAVMAELERDIIREQMLENRIAKAKKGVPTSGEMPIGRTFDRERNAWVLDEEMAGLLRQAAREYLDGGQLRAIADRLRARNPRFPKYGRLTFVLAERCGDTWSLNFEGEKPIAYTVPHILDEDTIRRVRDRLAFNRRSRDDVRKYVLTGFLWCELCGRALNGQTQISRNRKTSWQYYQHPARCDCKAFHSVPLKPLEDAVFKTIFENIHDEPAFQKAIAQSLPDENLIRNMQEKEKAGERGLKRIDKELDKLVELALRGTLKKQTITAKETSLLASRQTVSAELDELRIKLRSMPDLQRVKQEAETIRRQLLQRFSGKNRLAAMTFEEKKQLLHWLFDGKDHEGHPYGIYVSARGRAEQKKTDYFLWGKITGLRTLKGDDINYQDWDEDEYKTASAAR